MHKIITLAFILGAALLAAGCADVNVDVSDFRVPGGQQASPPPPPDPGSDPRGAAEIQRDNAQLRRTLAELEKNHRDWEVAIDRKEREIEALKDQRHDLEEQRDRAEDAAKRD
jgi:hypothetical protein